MQERDIHELRNALVPAVIAAAAIQESPVTPDVHSRAVRITACLERALKYIENEAEKMRGQQ